MKPPVKNYKQAKYPEGDVTQWFGENPELYARWGLLHHNGIDIVNAHGTPLYAVEDARVVSIKDNPDGFGKHIRIRSDKKYDNKYRIWTYAHCSSFECKEGQQVKAGDHIANMGNTGFVVSGATPFWEYNPYAGTHLHLGLRLVEEDASGWRYSGDIMKITVLNYDNGVKGAVDPAPYLADFEADGRRRKLLTLISLLNQVVVLLQRKKELST